MDIKIEQGNGTGSHLSKVFDGDRPLGTIIDRKGSHFPEPAATDWAQDEISFLSQAEAIAFLVGADWMAANQPSGRAPI